MKTTRPISPSVALGDILAEITQTLPDDGCRAFHPPAPSVARPPGHPSATPAPAAPRPTVVTDAPDYALFIAIDWADDPHDVCVLDPATPGIKDSRSSLPMG